MNRPFRKTTQWLAPAIHPSANGGFDIYPAYPLGAGLIEPGFEALARQLARHERIVIDGMGGVMWHDFQRRLAAALKGLGVHYEWVDVRDALKDEDDIDQMLSPFLGGNDPLFGKRSTLSLRDYFRPDKLDAARHRAESGKRTILFGPGAALCGVKGLVVYVDVPKNEIQFRNRAGTVANLGVETPMTAKAAYKRFYFADWPVLREHQAALLPRVDVIVDSQRPDDPATMRGSDLRAGLAKAARSWVRVRPWFEPGPWGGQWMKRHFHGLSPDAPNLAWSFELISPENGLAFSSDDRLLEVSFDFLMAQEAAAMLGEFAPRFGREFPIRFDYLDTFGGGNLSLQCHPRPEYAWRHFGERFTQDETYYLTDCAPDARVFLGFQDGIEPGEFAQALNTCEKDGGALAVDRYVQSHPSRKHGLYLIPSGTIHCSGRDNLVLEISATPYIFTFKMYDWQRLDLDGRPRSLNIGRALDSLHFDRKGGRVAREFISQPRSISKGNGWELVHLPTHHEHFYDVHRFDFSTAVASCTDGSPHVLNLVEGSSVVLETPGHAPRKFAFGETFIVPAAVEGYRLVSVTGEPVKVIKAFLKPEARAVPGYLV